MAVIYFSISDIKVNTTIDEDWNVILTIYFSSSCIHGEFTCNDGSCIHIRHRCDLINHCDDNSDEFYCDKIRIDERVYDKDMAPVGKFNKDKRMTVKLNITDFLLEEIDFVRSEFIARFNLHMEWRDERLTFLNLQTGTKNIIPYSEISRNTSLLLKKQH